MHQLKLEADRRRAEEEAAAVAAKAAADKAAKTPPPPPPLPEDPEDPGGITMSEADIWAAMKRKRLNRQETGG